MRFGCLASLVLWSALVSLLLGSAVPAAIGGLFLAFLIVYRGMHSDWPLY